MIGDIRKADPEALLAEVIARRDNILSVVQVTTPDPATNLQMNRWLLYQTLSCRIWARAGFSQAGGAYGFRDQLQDGMAPTLTRPDLSLQHLLRAAAHQFPEGDVQHWWRPLPTKGSARGSRMTASGCPSPSPRMSRHRQTGGCWRSRSDGSTRPS